MTAINSCGKHLSVAVQSAGSDSVRVRIVGTGYLGRCELPNMNRPGKTCGSWAWYVVTPPAPRREPTCSHCGATETLTGINTKWACPKHIETVMFEETEAVRDFLDRMEES